MAKPFGGGGGGGMGLDAVEVGTRYMMIIMIYHLCVKYLRTYTEVLN